MNLSATFQLVVEKLPLKWKDFKNYLEHKQWEENSENLIA